MRVDVNPEILKWAAHRSGKMDGMSEEFPYWEKWMNHESQPTFKQVEKLSKVTSTPLGYFFLDHPPVERLSIPHFRTVDDGQRSLASPELMETVHTMERRQEWMRDT